MANFLRKNKICKYKKAFVFDRYYNDSACKTAVADYAQIFYTVYKVNSPSFRHSMRIRRTKSTRKADGKSFFFFATRLHCYRQRGSFLKT